MHDSPGCGKSNTAGYGAAKHTGSHYVPLNDVALRPPLKKEKMFVGNPRGNQGVEHVVVRLVINIEKPLLHAYLQGELMHAYQPVPV